ncbi:hypothetical protein COV15_01880 [Candidatus Woesearchaeota archaeon CG10_big_fil_rev_8_21_14_0_10_34_12]|nr:MAG: hypothetical protein COV15_01880 [Candidatus Woesearchaeota archaeon CG10_big_fil_rev_8_21_14_0_10_34_12]
MVDINISNKMFYSLIVIMLFLIVGVSVYAYNTNNPEVFGHSAGEISGISGGSAGCELVGESPLGTGIFSIEAPSYCKNSNGCYVVLVTYTSAGAVNNVRGALYNQYDIGSRGYWGATESTVNGDTVATNIVYIPNLALQDDRSGTETDKDHWSIYDGQSALSSKVYACS